MKKHRLIYLDCTKGIAILFMMLNHYWSSDNVIYDWIYSFHVPTFFVISGILLNYTSVIKKTIREIIFLKIKTLIVPYLFFELIFVLIFGIIHRFDYNQLRWHFYDGLLMNPTNGPLWFLIVLFWGEILFISMTKFVKNEKIVFVLSALIYIIPFMSTSNNLYVAILLKTCTAIGFLEMGYISCKVVENMEVSIIAVLLVLIVEVFMSYINGKVNMYDLNYGNPFLYTVCAAGGTFAWILLFKKINSRLLSLIGKNTLFLLGTHMIIGSFIIRVLPVNPQNFLGAIIILFITSLCSVPGIVIINKYFPALVGKYSK